MTAEIDDKDKEVNLGRNNLFVVPVTYKLLTTANRAMDVDIPYAFKNSIPVLPFMMEYNLGEFYSLPDKFGEMQYLDPHVNDATAIPYEEKLKKYLESVLIGDEMAKRVRSAFDAYIFLSYRKKDRQYANELMQLIHRNPEYRDIAIWFDEFLTPGESFRANIEKMLDDCKLFTLLVTPNLLEKVTDKNGVERDNFVVSEELPLARKKKQEKDIDILPVEMEHTDRAALASIEVTDCIDPRDETAFRTRLLDTISKIARSENDDDTEHNFLIGLAYLNGIDVEVDRERGLELIIFAAENGLLEAMEYLRDVYTCQKTPLSAHQALKWAYRASKHCQAEYGSTHPKTLASVHMLGVCYENSARPGEVKESIEQYKNAYSLRRKVLGANHPDTLESLIRLTRQYIYWPTIEAKRDAIKLSNKVYKKRCKLSGKNHPDTITALLVVADSLNRFCPKKALKKYIRVYNLRKKVFGETHPETLGGLFYIMYNLPSKRQAISDYLFYTLCNTPSIQNDPDTQTHLLHSLQMYNQGLGNCAKASDIGVYLFTKKGYTEKNISLLAGYASAYETQGYYQKALEVYEQVYLLRRNSLGEEANPTILTIRDIANICNELGDFKKSFEFYEKAYRLQCKTLGEKDKRTLESLSDLANASLMLGNLELASEYSERGYELCCKTLGKTHPITLRVLQTLYYTTGYLREDNPEHIIMWSNTLAKYGLHDNAYKLRCHVLGESHPDALTSFYNLIEHKPYQQQLELYERVYNLRCKALGKKHPDTVKTLQKLAITHSNLHCHPKALKLYKKVYRLQCKTLGKNHLDTLQSLCGLAKQETKHKKLRSLKKLCRILQKNPSAEHASILSELHDIARGYYYHGKYTIALDLFKKTHMLRCKILGEAHCKTIDTLHYLGPLYHKLKDYPKALKFYKKEYNHYCRIHGEESRNILDALCGLTKIHIDLGNYTHALKLGQKGYPICQKAEVEDHARGFSGHNRLKYDFLCCLVDALVQLGDYSTALSHQEELVYCWLEDFGEANPATIKAQNRLNELRKKVPITT